MKSFLKIMIVETKLFFREPATWVIALLLPPFVLLILDSLPSLRSAQELFGGQRFLDPFVPSRMVISLATLGVNALPIRLATQREGELRVKYEFYGERQKRTSAIRYFEREGACARCLCRKAISSATTSSNNR